MSLAELSVRRPVTTLMCYAGLVLLGLVVVRRLGVDFLPPIAIPRLIVHTADPGASPAEVDETVTQPIASALATVARVKKTASRSRTGVSIVNAEFFWGTRMDHAMLDVREKLDQLQQMLPRTAGRPTILAIDPSSEPVMVVGVTSAAGESEASLQRITEACHALVRKRLEQAAGVAQVLVIGGVERELRVDLNAAELNSLGISAADVARTIEQANINMAGGTIRKASLRYSLRALGELSSARDLNNVIIRTTPAGRPIRLGEVASVHDTLAGTQGTALYNGRAIVALQVRKEAGASTLTVSGNLHEIINRLREDYTDLRLDVLSDQAAFIHDSVADVEQAAVAGGFLALLVLFFFLRSGRSALIIALTMPVCVIVTFAGMYVLGLTLNVISLSGLALGIGMLGDNAIMVIENSARLRQGGMPSRAAVLSGAREINLAVTASTLTNVVVFLPVVMVNGVAQQLFADMAVTMTLALLVSLIVAVTLVPVLIMAGERSRWRSRFALPGSCITAIGHKASAAIDIWSNLFLDRALRYIIPHKRAVLGMTGMLFAVAIAAAFLIPGETAPAIDQKRLTICVSMPKGASPEEVLHFAKRLESAVRTVPGIGGVYTVAGLAGGQDFWSVADAAMERIVLEISTTATAGVDRAAAGCREAVERSCAAIQGAAFKVKPAATTFEHILRPQPNDIAIRITGRDPAVSLRIAQDLAARIRGIPGLVDFVAGPGDNERELCITTDRQRLHRYSFTGEDVTDHLARQASPAEAAYLEDVDQRLAVRINTNRGETPDLRDILSSSMLANGARVPVGALVRCEERTVQSEIRREDQQRVYTMTGNVEGRPVGAVVSEINLAAGACARPPGYAIVVGGENEEMAESFRSLAIVIGLSLCLVYMILASEYESLIYPFVILLTSPLAFIGAVAAMVIAGERYNVMSLVGIVIMIGAVDNDAVIAVDLITSLRRQGLASRDAVWQGMRQRLRPILMTTATTVLGIVPLVAGYGAGSELIRALTIPIAGGLIASTVFTLLVIPAVYLMIDR